MKHRVTSRLSILSLVVLTGLFISFDTANAQEISSKKSSNVVITKDGVSVNIDVKDGETRVNGVLVPEGADIADYLPEGFESDVLILDDGAVRMFGSREDGLYSLKKKIGGEGGGIWFSDDDEHPRQLHLDTAKKLAGQLRGLQEQKFELAQMPNFNRLTHYAVGNSSSPHSPEISKKERMARELAEKMGRSDNDERSVLESELDDLLEEIFDAKLELREEKMQHQRKEIEEQEAELSERRQRRDEIIQRRKAELTGSVDRYRW